MAAKADSRFNGDASGPGCPCGTVTRSQASPFSCRPPGGSGHDSELGDQLRPDRDHPDEQRDRRQRRSLFHECLQHARLLKYGNIRRTLFPVCSWGVKGVVGHVIGMVKSNKSGRRHSLKGAKCPQPAHFPRCDIHDGFGVPKALGALVGQLSIAIRCTPSSVRTMPPRTSLV